MSDRATINAQGIEVTFCKGDAYADYVSLTDIARYKSPTPKDVIKNWMRTHDVIGVFGKPCTIQALKGSNSTPLKLVRAAI